VGLRGAETAHFHVFLGEKAGGRADAIAVAHFCYLQKSNRAQRTAEWTDCSDRTIRQEFAKNGDIRDSLMWETMN